MGAQAKRKAEILPQTGSVASLIMTTSQGDALLTGTVGLQGIVPSLASPYHCRVSGLSPPPPEGDEGLHGCMASPWLPGKQSKDQIPALLMPGTPSHGTVSLGKGPGNLATAWWRHN